MAFVESFCVRYSSKCFENCCLMHVFVILMNNLCSGICLLTPSFVYALILVNAFKTFLAVVAKADVVVGPIVDGTVVVLI